MRTNIVFTFIGDDRAGLIHHVSEVVAEHDGNWLASRLCRMAGKFAGIIQVGVEESRVADLRAALQEFNSEGLSTVVEHGRAAPGDGGPCRTLRLEVFGLDRRNIVRDISQALAAQGINVAEMTTEITPAPMTGEIMFGAEAEIEVPDDVDLDSLAERLDQVSLELTVGIELIPEDD